MKCLGSAIYEDALRSVLNGHELDELVGRPVIKRLCELNITAQSRVLWFCRKHEMSSGQHWASERRAASSRYRTSRFSTPSILYHTTRTKNEQSDINQYVAPIKVNVSAIDVMKSSIPQHFATSKMGSKAPIYRTKYLLPLTPKMISSCLGFNRFGIRRCLRNQPSVADGLATNIIDVGAIMMLPRGKVRAQL